MCHRHGLRSVRTLLDGAGMDVLSKTARSAQMALVCSRDTKLELRVRRLVWSMGYRYRLCVRGLPGKPDLVFRRRRCVIFVHGCFWHGHRCALGRLPKSRVDFWRAKIYSNRERDVRNILALDRLGWRCLLIWECETKDLDCLRDRIRDFLENQ